MDTCSGTGVRPKDVDAVSTVVRGILQTCCIRRGRRGGDVIGRVEAQDQLRRPGCKAEAQGEQQEAVRWTWTSIQSPWGGKIGGCAKGPRTVSFRPLGTLFRRQTVVDFCLLLKPLEIRWNSCSTQRNTTRVARPRPRSRENTQISGEITQNPGVCAYLAAQASLEPQILTPLGGLVTFFPHRAGSQRPPRVACGL